MGFFKRKKEDISYRPRYENANNKAEINYSITKDGKLQIEFIDNEAKSWNYYDTTRLIFSGRQEMLNNKYIQECLVSWYGQDDVIMLREGDEEIGRRADYTKVLADIDFSLIQSDTEYCKMVMKQLLKQRRVEDYLANGLQEKTERPSGEYIGGIMKVDNRYKKVFDLKAGKESHYKPDMLKKRESYKKKQEEIAKKSTEREEMNGERNDLFR